MTVYARDCSNYTVDTLPLDQWKAEGVGLVIIQAFPLSYHQYAEQRAQMAACAAAGLPFDCYVYDYLGDPTWLWGALDGLDQIFLPSHKPRMVWLDEEDVETEAGWLPSQRVTAMSGSIASVIQRGYRCGIYSSPWWWTPRTANSWAFDDLPLWAAEYDGIADALVFTTFGGWDVCAIKQYAGTQPDGTDLNVLSAAEEAELLGGTEDVADCQSYKDALARAVNRLQIEDERKDAKGNAATLRRTIIREIASEAFQALQT